MLCHHCGMDIANKALICFRCGAATSERVREPVPAPNRSALRRVWIPIGLAGGLALMVAFFMMQLSGGEPPARFVWAMLAAAAGLLAWRLRLTR